MKPVAIIPARGGSKRIPRKNIRFFDGKPVISYAIETALQSKLFREIIVSTDDQEIADISIQYGANVPFFRSKQNSNDHATTAEVLIEVLGNLASSGHEYAEGCCIYPVNPFLTVENLLFGSEKFKTGYFDSVISAVKFDFPVQRSFFIKEDKIEFLFPESMLKRSQDLQPVYHDAGQFYYFNAQRLFETGQLVSGASGIIEIPATSVQDIDTLTDWELAEIKFQRLKNA